MKTFTPEFQTHLDGEVTSLANCWRLTRRDKKQFYFTEHDQPLPIDLDATGVQTYDPTSSYNRSAMKNDDGLSVDNLDLTGVLNSEEIDETELRRGLFDYAAVEIFLVNWQDLTQGVGKLRKGRIGEVTISANGFFQSELRGLTQNFSRTIIELYSPMCRTDLGDERCKVPIAPEVAVRSKSYQVGDYVRAASELETIPSSVFLSNFNTSADNQVGPQTGTLGTEAAIQTVQKKFGTGSIEFSPTAAVDPSQAFASYADQASYTIGAAEFTIECWVRFKDLTEVIQVLMSQSLNTGDERAWIVRRNGDNLEIFLSDDGTTVAPALTIPGAFVWAIDTDYHVAVTRDASDDVRMFVDGVQVGVTTAVAFAIHDSSAVLHVGKRRSAGFSDQPLDGFIDDSRITIGAALYVANFTPPISEFQTIEEAVAALTCESFDDRVYLCTTAGTTDPALQPPYDTIIGNTTADGSAVFTTEPGWTRCVEVTAVDISEARKKFTVTELTPNSGGTTPGRDFFPDDSMNGGVVGWDTGTNTGEAMEVRVFTADDGITITQEIELYLDMPFDIAVGDKASIYRGCFHRLLPDCRDIFDNVNNFRGETYVPGQDVLTNYPDAKS